MRTELYIYFCIKKYIGTQGEVCRQLKIFFNPTPAVVYATDRSKAVVPGMFLFCVALWFILRALHVLKSSRALFPRVLFIPFNIVVTSLGEVGVCELLVHLFVCFVRVSF